MPHVDELPSKELIPSRRRIVNVSLFPMLVGGRWQAQGVDAHSETAARRKRCRGASLLALLRCRAEQTTTLRDRRSLIYRRRHATHNIARSRPRNTAHCHSTPHNPTQHTHKPHNKTHTHTHKRTDGQTSGRTRQTDEQAIQRTDGQTDKHQRGDAARLNGNGQSNGQVV